MNEIEAVGTIILFFALRCIVPLAITLGIGYLMNRLVDHWEQEEAAAKEAEVVTPAAIPLTMTTDTPASKIPCWITRDCDEDKRASCPAYLDQSLPCWIARLLAEGAKPSSCPDCPVYDPKLVIN